MSLTIRAQHTSAAALLVAALSILTGCSSDGTTVKQADLEKRIAATVGKHDLGAVEKVECPGELDGKVGEKLRCSTTFADKAGKKRTYAAYVTVTTADSKGVAFRVEVDQRKPDPSDKDETRDSTDQVRDKEYAGSETAGD